MTAQQLTPPTTPPGEASRCFCNISGDEIRADLERAGRDLGGVLDESQDLRACGFLSMSSAELARHHHLILAAGSEVGHRANVSPGKREGHAMFAAETVADSGEARCGTNGRREAEGGTAVGGVGEGHSSGNLVPSCSF